MDMTKLILHQDYFSGQEKTILQSGQLSAATFRYASGVCGLRLRNGRGCLVILPFQGQQIWRADFDGCDLTMQSMFDEPVPTDAFLENYGGFLLHCGATAMGVPTVDDHHPLHGELPNMRYETAFVESGQDRCGRFLALGGKAEHRIAFGTHYAAEPVIRLYEDETSFEITMRLTNLRTTPMDWMYLCHINFRPIAGSRLLDSAPADPEHFAVHMNIPEELPADRRTALQSYMEAIAADPAIHQVIGGPNQIYDPEIVLTIRHRVDTSGYAHSMQLMPAGDACFVSYQPSQLPFALRWIARTGDEDALGLLLPATAEHQGYSREKALGRVRRLAGGASVTLNIRAGYLDREAAAAMTDHIQRV